MRRRTKYVLKSIPSEIKIFTSGVFYCLRRKKLSRVYRYNQLRKMVFVQNRLCNMNFHITGEENIPLELSSVIVVNHESFFDNFALIQVFKDPLAFVAKVELSKIPFVGKTVGAFDSVFLERDNLKSEIKTMRQVRDSLLKDNIRWVIYPEGTRTKDPEFKMGQFKAGSFKYPMSIGKDIIPVALLGTRNVFDDNFHGKINDIYVHVFEPIKKEDYQNLTTQELSDKVENMIRSKVNEFYLDFKKRNNIN